MLGNDVNTFYLYTIIHTHKYTTMTSKEVLLNVYQGKARMIDYVAALAQEEVNRHIAQKEKGILFLSFQTSVFAPDGKTEIGLLINFTYTPAVEASHEEAGADEQITITDIWETWQQTPGALTGNMRVKYEYDFTAEQWRELQDACVRHMEKMSRHD